MYPDPSKAKDYENFVLSQCARCSLRFDLGSPRTTKLRVLRNDENSADYDEISNIDVLSFVYGIPSSTLNSNLVSNLQDFNTARESAEMRADWLNIKLSDIDIAAPFSLALCESCAPKLADLYSSHKEFVNNLAVDSFVSKATNRTPASCNTQIHPHNSNTDFQASEKFTHTVKVENESLPIDDYAHFSDSEHLEASPYSPEHFLQPESDNKINLVEKDPSSGLSKDKRRSRKDGSFQKKRYCQECDIQFTSDYGTSVHKIEIHDGLGLDILRQRVKGPPFICPLAPCEKRFKTQPSVKYHCLHRHRVKLLTTNDKGKFSFCSICRISFLKKTLLLLHQSKVHPEGIENDEAHQLVNVQAKLKCHRCQSEYKSLEDLQKHGLESHTPQIILERQKVTNGTKVRCLQCQLTYDDISELNIHCENQHESKHAIKKELTEPPSDFNENSNDSRILSNNMDSQKPVKRRGRPPLKQKTKRIRNRRKIQPSFKDGSVYNFYCKTCDRCWKYVQELKAHNQCCHNSWKKYFCIECDTEHKSLNLLSNHSLKIHNKKIDIDEKISCSECELTFTNVPELENHVEEVHKIFQCSNCLNNFSSNEFREIHFKRHSPDFPNNRCEFCEKDFQNIYSVQAHQQHTHFKELMLPEIIEKCPYCEKTYKWKSHVKKHILQYHTLEKPHKCEKCSKSFATRNLLSSHIKRAHATEKKFKCPHCDKSFSHISPYKQHLVKHSDERPFACDICEKRFKREFELGIHMDVHGPAEKKFFCEKCGSGFKRKGHFHLHMRKHEDLEKEDASFDCKICGIKLKHSQSLKTHMRWKHPPANSKGKHFCEVCNKKFKNSERLSRHNKNKHSNEKEPIFNERQLNETIQSGTKAPRDEENVKAESLGSSVSEFQSFNAGLNQPMVSSAPILHPIPFPVHRASSIPYPPVNYNVLDNCSSQYFHI